MALNKLTLVVGDDELLVARAVEDAVGVGDVEIDRVDAAGLEPGTLVQLLSPQLFATHRVVVVSAAQNLSKSTTEKIKVLARDLDEETRLVATVPAKASTVVKTFNGLGATVVRTTKVSSARDKVGFVRDEARKGGRRITDSAARVVVDATGGNLRAISGAVSQLLSDTDEMLTDEVVRNFYDATPETTGFAVADAATSGDAVEALSTLRGAMASGTAPVLVANALVTSVRDMTRARGLGTTAPAGLAASLGVPEWRAEKTLRKLRGWSDLGLARALEAAVGLDALVKGGTVDVGFALERAVLAIATSKRY